MKPTPSTAPAAMTESLAARLFDALGASPVFIDDVLGDLEELRCQRRVAGERCGQGWYAAEVARALPHALQDGLRGVGVAQLLDWGQKALAAWVLVAAVQVLVGGMVFATWLRMVPGSDLPSTGLPFHAFVVALVMATTSRYLLLGYAAAWMERRQPLLVTLMAALCDGALHALLVMRATSEIRIALVVSATAAVLVITGGLLRIVRPVGTVSRWRTRGGRILG